MPASTSPPPAASARPPGGDEPIVLAGRYRLERRLAQGGMAEVWLATDLSLDRKVALKWLKPSLATDPVVAERFRREAIAVAGLTHPNIVAVHDVFEDQGRQAVVMQLVDGKSLRQLLDVQTRLSPELTIHIGACVAAALDTAHRAGFVHRDVKPGNILVTADGRVLLTDFGIAKGLDTSEDDLTSDNVMMGTAKYLSPEQVRGRRLDGRADLYSLGLVLYECLAGRVPFLGETDADTALARLQRDPTDLGRLRPTLPRGLVNLIHRLLSRNPNHRPATGADLRAELLRVADEPPADLTPLGAPPAPSSGTETSITGPSPVGPFIRVPRQTGPLPRTRPGAPPIPGEATPPNPVGRRPRDPTPAGGPPMRGKPARGMQSRTGPSMLLVLSLLVVAFVVALILWITIGRRDAGSGGPSTSTAGPPAADGAATITGITTYDPEGDGSENDGQASAALADGSPSTNWTTVCYRQTTMGKDGVGLVVTLGAATTGTLTFHVGNPPFQVEVFGVDTETVPAGFDGWGPPLQNKTFSQTAGPVSVPTPVPVKHLLIVLREIGRDPGCSANHPNRGSIGEISFG
jgi:eukaryotic-like serine/threonine-protein kinase